MIKKILNTILIVLFLTGLAYADQGGTGGNAYMWTDDSAPGTFINGLYNWVDAKDGNSLFGSTQIDSQVSGSVSIPFSFDFFGNSKNSINVSANGFITFSSASAGFNTNDALPSSLGPTEMIAPYWDDLVGNVSQGADIYTKTIGSSPFRQFIVQWVLPDSLNFLEFQVVLYETSNQIKFQYGRLTSDTTPGVDATVGIQAAAGSLQKSFEEQIFEYSAVLFHGEGVSQADASISPTSTSVNTFQEFTYTINNIDPPNSGALGKVDNVSIKIPFATNPIVTGIQINGGNAIIQNSPTKPSNRGFATWTISNDNLIIQTAEFEVIDDLVVTFYQQMPGTTSTDSAYTSTASADYDNAGAATVSPNPDWSVDVTGSAPFLDYYNVTPVAGSTTTAGSGLQYTLTAFDQNGLPFVNSSTVALTTIGSSTATFSPNNTLTFSSSSTVNFTVTDTIKGTFTIKAVNINDVSISGTSSLVTVNAATGAAITILSSQANIIAGTDRLLRVSLDDQYGNRVGAGLSIDFEVFTGTGSFAGSSSTSAVTNQNGEAEVLYTASSTLTPVDEIVASFNITVTDTISMTVVAGSLAEVRIQTNTAADGPVLGDSTITADQTLTLYAVGYDAAGVHLGNVSSNWTGSGVVTSLAPANPSTSVVFTAITAGSGSITARAASNSAIKDNSGAITVTAGAISTIRIMDAPNGTGADIGIVNMITGAVLHLYANGFDSDGNFNSNVAVTWNAGTLTGISAGVTSHATLTPTAAGSDSVQTVSAFTDDATGLITVSTTGATLYSLAIRTGANNTGVILENSTIAAGNSLALFAAGFDVYGNYIADQAVSWTVDNVAGDSTGFFTTPSSTNIANNTFNARIVNSGRLKITSGAISDYSGIIKVTNGTPTLLQAASPQLVSGSSGSPVPDSLSVRLFDGFGNVVPNATILWSTPTNGSLAPASNTTNLTGISRAKWTLRSSAGINDTAFATYGALTPVQFTANVVASTADSLQKISGDGQSAAVGTALASNFVVRVVDNNNNPVPNVSVTFAITQTPAGASGQSLSVGSILTDAAGLAQTLLTLGDKVGTYVVSVTNAQLLGNPVTETTYVPTLSPRVSNV